eukprot:scaffold51553_cov30-Tisochrysis_lutea.AAC.8
MLSPISPPRRPQPWVPVMLLFSCFSSGCVACLRGHARMRGFVRARVVSYRSRQDTDTTTAPFIHESVWP